MLKCLTSFSSSAQRYHRQPISHMPKRRWRCSCRSTAPQHETCRNNILNNIRCTTFEAKYQEANDIFCTQTYQPYLSVCINSILCTVQCDKSVANISILVGFYDSILFHFISPQVFYHILMRCACYVHADMERCITYILERISLCIDINIHPSIHSIRDPFIHYYVSKDIDRLTLLRVIEKIILSLFIFVRWINMYHTTIESPSSVSWSSIAHEDPISKVSIWSLTFS